MKTIQVIILAAMAFIVGRETAPRPLSITFPPPNVSVVTPAGHEIQYKIVNGQLVDNDPLHIR